MSASCDVLLILLLITFLDHDEQAVVHQPLALQQGNVPSDCKNYPFNIDVSHFD